MLGFLTMALVMATARRGLHALRLRRPADPGPGRAHLARRPHAPGDPRRRARPGAGRDLLVRPLRAGHQGLAAAHRHPLHRRPRRAAGQGDPRDRRPDDGRAVHRLDLDPLLAAARSSASPCCSSPRSWSAASTRRSTSGSRSSPSEKSLEQVYIDRNIKATRAAYGIADVETKDYTATTEATPGPAARRRRDDPRHPPGRPHRRLADVQAAPVGEVLLRLPRRARRRPLHDQRQGPRHRRGGARARPRTASRPNQRNWLNDHTVYTHGFGVVAAYGNQRGADGAAGLLRAATSRRRASCGDFEPRIYFGEQSPTYSIVGAATGSQPARVRLPGQQRRRARRTTPTPARAASPIGVVPAQARLRAEVPRAQHPAVRRGQRQEPDPRPPRAARAGRAGRAVADPRRQPLPGGRRRPGPVDRRRLHDDGRLPLLAADRRSTARPPTRSPRRSQCRHGRSAAARSTTSATRSRRPSTPTTAR